MKLRSQSRSKYHNIRVQEDGYTFDSKAEVRYYHVLKALMTAGEITQLRVHPRFELLEKPNRIVYVPDFQVVYQDGRQEAIDVKGFVTKDFKIKAKLFAAKYPNLPLRLVKP